MIRIKNEFRKTFLIRKSRFIICAAPILSAEDAHAYITSLRKEFPDADHIPYAYLLHDIHHSSDNNEPSSTAGLPLAKAIEECGADCVCIGAVRYFGGIKLGAAGLANAYGECAKTTLKAAPKVIVKEKKVFRVSYPYELTGNVEGWLRRHAQIVKIAYGEDTVTAEVMSDDDIGNNLRKLSAGKAAVELAGTVECEEEWGKK